MSLFEHGSRGRPETVRDRVLTVPNALSLLRVLVLPLVYLDIVGGREIRALVVLAAVSATDFVDGWIARRFDQVSRLGKVIDPVSDRLLVGVVGVAMIVAGILPLWAVVLVLARDALVLVGGLVLVVRGHAPPPVTDLGKAATFGLMASLPVFLLGAGLDSDHLHSAAWVGLASFGLLYWLSAGQYAVMVKGDLGAARGRRS
jgi:cardiolipin synthase (CMP-forming)